MNGLPPGRYRHYKGQEYTVLGVARHSETEEQLVVYRQEYGDRSLWVRPVPMFLESVLIDGSEVPRFRGLEEGAFHDVHGSLWGDVPAELPAELVRTLVSTDSFRIEAIVSHGHTSPAGFWYDQDQHEWVLLLRGKSRLLFDGDPMPVDMAPGDYIHIPARRRHRVEWTTPDELTIWLAVHYGAP